MAASSSTAATESSSNPSSTSAPASTPAKTTDGIETVLYSFAPDPDGAAPAGSLVQGPNGNLYGTTSMGGDKGRGTVFKITTAGVETVLHTFSGGADGMYPNGSLILGRDGNLYGMTKEGGRHSFGTVFELKIDLA